MNGSLFPRIHVTEQTGRLFAISTEVADFLHKQHFHLLREIRSILEENKDLAIQFRMARYDHRGKKEPCYRITETGVGLLIVKLGGRGMDAIKFAYVEQFTLMRHGMVERCQAKESAKLMGRTVEDTRKKLGKETKDYHYSNEHDLCDRVLLGCTLKKYRTNNGIGENVPLSEFLSPDEIHRLADIRTDNSRMIQEGMSSEERKQALHQRHKLNAA